MVFEYVKDCIADNPICTYTVASLVINNVPYLRLKQHSKPDLPRNQQHPTKRITARAAVDQSSARKKFDVLFVELFYKLSLAPFPSTQKG